MLQWILAFFCDLVGMSHVLPNISRGRFSEPIFASKKFDLYTSIYGIRIEYSLFPIRNWGRGRSYSPEEKFTHFHFQNLAGLVIVDLSWWKIQYPKKSLCFFKTPKYLSVFHRPKEHPFGQNFRPTKILKYVSGVPGVKHYRKIVQTYLSCLESPANVPSLHAISSTDLKLQLSVENVFTVPLRRPTQTWNLNTETNEPQSIQTNLLAQSEVEACEVWNKESRNKKNWTSLIEIKL